MRQGDFRQHTADFSFPCSSQMEQLAQIFCSSSKCKIHQWFSIEKLQHLLALFFYEQKLTRKQKSCETQSSRDGIDKRMRLKQVMTTISV